jgi:hypothetical protein
MVISDNLFKRYTTDSTHKIIIKDRGDYELKVHLDKHNRKIAIYSSLNYWKIFQYNDEGKKIYEHDSDGNWEKRKYRNNKIVQYTNSSGTHWVKNI